MNVQSEEILHRRGLYRFCGMRLKFKWVRDFKINTGRREAGFYSIAESGIDKNTMAIFGKVHSKNKLVKMTNLNWLQPI